MASRSWIAAASLVAIGLVCAVDAVSASGPNRCRGAASGIGFSTDLSGLVGKLLRGQRDDTTSRRIRLVDTATGREGWLHFALEPGDDHFLGVLALDRVPDRERVFVHSVGVDLAQEQRLDLRILEWKLGALDSGEETVIVHLDEAQLRRVANANSVVLDLRGFERSYRAELEEKDVAKIRRYQERFAPEAADRR